MKNISALQNANIVFPGNGLFPEWEEANDVLIAAVNKFYDPAVEFFMKPEPSFVFNFLQPGFFENIPKEYQNPVEEVVMRWIDALIFIIDCEGFIKKYTTLKPGKDVTAQEIQMHVNLTGAREEFEARMYGAFKYGGLSPKALLLWMLGVVV